MPSDYENGAKKTIDISIKAEKMTADVLKSALQEFMSGKAEKKGRMTYKQLHKVCLDSHFHLPSSEFAINRHSATHDTVASSTSLIRIHSGALRCDNPYCL